MTAIHFSETVDIDVDAEHAWRIVADYSHDHRWRTGVISMTSSPTGLVDTGTTTLELMKLAGRSYRNAGIVTSVEPGVRFTWRTVEGASASGSRSVTALADDRCRVSLELTVTPKGIDRLFRPITARMLARNLRRDSDALRSLVESAATSTSTI
ncbi:MAG: SRPBCC family protein [Actinomycetota bacterium]|nr:SRPBCC family protein [Actinomycetota bacterium]